MADYPHFSLPFRFEAQHDGSRRIPVTEENTIDEIGDCIELLLRTVEGERGTLPGFGRPQIEFAGNRELARSLVQQVLDEYEPRVRNIVERADLDPDDEGVLRLLTMYGVSE